MLYKTASGSSNALNWITYIQPLHFSIWILTLLAISMSAVAFAIVALLHQSHKERKQNLCLFGIYGFLMQGCPEEPNPMSSRIVYILVFILSWLIWNAYNATLTSFLSVKVEKPPFQSFKEMLSNTDYKIVSAESMSVLDVFKVLLNTAHFLNRLVFNATCF